MLTSLRILSSSVTRTLHFTNQHRLYARPRVRLEGHRDESERTDEEALFLMEETELQSDDSLHRLGSTMTKVKTMWVAHKGR